jgi:hypothetical protein
MYIQYTTLLFYNYGLCMCTCSVVRQQHRVCIPLLAGYVYCAPYLRDFMRYAYVLYTGTVKYMQFALFNTSTQKIYCTKTEKFKEIVSQDL